MVDSGSIYLSRAEEIRSYLLAQAKKFYPGLFLMSRGVRSLREISFSAAIRANFSEREIRRCLNIATIASCESKYLLMQGIALDPRIQDREFNELTMEK